ncbi:FHA domain-containing protein [Streptomyces sp. KL2]|uniref:FHA domain-containing protein n=1 Tax=Streptomyces sp. KL2 TaxID=3050126 RepID=UPI00397AD1E3
MASAESRAVPPRPSDEDRERAMELLRESAVAGRVSHRTFEHRMELLLTARRFDEIEAAVHDLRPLPPEPALIRFVGAVSALPGRLRRAWRTARLPELMLPAPGPYPMSIGRAPGSVLRLNDETVSRTHAQLHSSARGWTLRDLGSSNGTWVNGRRVTGSVSVRPGDHVRFGQVGFRLGSR